MAGDVHRDVRQRRGQVARGLAGGARVVHSLGEHLGEQVEAHCRHVARLLGPQHAARPADLQIAHGNAHAAAQILVLVDGRQTRGGLLGQGHVLGEHEVGEGLHRRAAHATLQLVHLREAQPLGVLDDERVGMRVVDAALDDGGGHEHVQLAGGELLHHALQLFLGHLPVGHAHPCLAGRGVHAVHRLVDGAHPVAHIVHLTAPGQLVANGRAHHVGIPLSHVHLHRAPLVGRREDERHIAHARQRHLHGARNGRGRQREHVDGLAQVLQLLFVLHAEALLLVDDDKPQIVRIHIAREQPVGAHEHLHLSRCEALERPDLLLVRAEAREHLHGDAEGSKAVLEGGVVLLGQNGGGAQHHHLLAVLGGFEGGA